MIHTRQGFLEELYAITMSYCMDWLSSKSKRLPDTALLDILHQHKVNYQQSLPQSLSLPVFAAACFSVSASSLLPPPAVLVVVRWVWGIVWRGKRVMSKT